MPQQPDMPVNLRRRFLKERTEHGHLVIRRVSQERLQDCRQKEE